MKKCSATYKDHYSPALYGVALKVVNDENTAVDVTGDLFEDLARY